MFVQNSSLAYHKDISVCNNLTKKTQSHRLNAVSTDSGFENHSEELNATIATSGVGVK